MSFDLDVVAILLATIAQFAIGMVWYGAIFGKLYGRMHGFDLLSEEEQKEMQSKMGPWYGLQLLLTIVTTTVLAMLLQQNFDGSPYLLAFFLWLGFVVPTQASAAIFGGAQPGTVGQKIAIQSGAALVCIMVATAIIEALS